MYSPTTRLLTVLELLQSQGSVSGPQFAEKLQVGVRSVRRYITALRDLGIPIESEPGRYGVYALRPGFRLPPMMFTNPEVLAIILGLAAARHLGLSGALGIESAVAKIERVLPETLREQVRAMQGVLSLNIKQQNITSSDEMMAKMIFAAHQQTQVWMSYQGQGRASTERVLDVYGLVFHAGYWYAIGYCHLREDIRIFRLDRIQQVRMLESTFTPPEDFDALRHLQTAIATIPHMWRIEVLLKTTFEDAQARVSPNMALLEALEDGVMMRCYAGDLDWMARFLVGLQCRLTVLEPAELRDELRRLAGFIMEIAGDG